jgi:hypothetical protein
MAGEVGGEGRQYVVGDDVRGRGHFLEHLTCIVLERVPRVDEREEVPADREGEEGERPAGEDKIGGGTRTSLEEARGRAASSGPSN